MVNCLAALVAAALSDGGRGDAAVVEVSSRAARDDELALRELFATSRCPHVYLDVGSNIGVQIRKLYQPELYPRSPVLRLFRANFGTDRCGVCAVGFEANRRHTQRLHTLQSRLRAAGAGVHVYVPAAAGSSDGISRFTFDQNNTCDTSTARIDCDTEGGSSAAPTATARNRPTAVLRTDVVRSIDLARILLLIDELMRAAAAAQARPQRGRLVMKLDVEGTEFALLPHLLATQALCVVDVAFIEWHDAAISAEVMNASAARLGLSATGAQPMAGMAASLKALMRSSLGHWHGASASRALERAGERPDCRTQLVDLDDEWYAHDNKAWPSKLLC